MHQIRTAFVALALTLVPAGAVFAQLSPPVARVTGNLAVHAGPGSDYRVIDRVRNGDSVLLAECTRGQTWCRIEGSGWVRGSYLVGMAAKERVSPVPLLDPLFRDQRGHRGWGLFPCSSFDPFC
ncbi:MAG: SH3 domain-containing protein [Devosia sp.]